MLLAVLMALVPQGVLADNTDDLQEFINQQTQKSIRTQSTSDVIVVDLSGFSAVERDKTLNIAT